MGGTGVSWGVCWVLHGPGLTTTLAKLTGTLNMIFTQVLQVLLPLRMVPGTKPNFKVVSVEPLAKGPWPR